MPNLEVSKNSSLRLTWSKSSGGKKNKACLGKIDAEKKGIPVTLTSKRHVTPPGTVTPHFGFSGTTPQLWWKDHLALSVPWGLWVFSVWAVSCSLYYHPNHMEHILHSRQSSDPLEMSLLHILKWAPSKGLLDPQMASLTVQTCGASNCGSWGSLSIACLLAFETLVLASPLVSRRCGVFWCHWVTYGFGHNLKLPPQKNMFEKMLCVLGPLPAYGSSFSSWC